MILHYHNPLNRRRRTRNPFEWQGQATCSWAFCDSIHFQNMS